MIARLLMALALLALAYPARAQQAIVIPTCGTANPAKGNSPLYVDANGNLCANTGASGATSGNGTLSVSASALINTMTVSATGAALPAGLSSLVAINLGTADAAFCPKGGTCTCPENGAANTNGITLLASGGGYIFNLAGTASSTPTVVSCSGTNIVQFQW